MFALAFALAIQLATQAPLPSASSYAWMSPQSFGFEIGMPRPEIEAKIARAGWKSLPGKYPRQLVVHYSDTKTVMLLFVDDKLQSARFELVDFIPIVRAAYEERVVAIEQELCYEGVKQKGDREVLLFSRESPNVMVVLSTLSNDDFGRQGLGFLAIRWFDPSAEKITD
ncbi:MAG: hypothetical protein NDJ92_06945 [Thermoanaerobaculia bacterium]|nr:hypothetical protein [Thermoanaerobaculia bacterium]